MITVKLNWRAYFEQFCEAHGESVQVGAYGTRARLLFRDGWMYSANDYAGPEYPPPLHDGRRNELITMYWRIRREKFTSERTRLKRLISFLEQMTEAKSCTLMQEVTYREEDEQGRTKVVVDSEPVNVEQIKEELRFTEEQITECDQELEQCQTEMAS